MPPSNSKAILKRLGAGEPIDTVWRSLGWSRPEFDAWWRAECERRVPATSGLVMQPGLESDVLIGRDQYGIPHIEAAQATDLFFGFGLATAQDRLFQLDFLRRKACGLLSEILGPAGLESDRLHRTIGLAAIAQKEWEALAAETRELLEAYTRGINVALAACGDCLPIEFDLLDYRPDPWQPTDSLAIAGEFRWYLTGRFPVIVVPELVKRALGDGPHYRAFLQGEADDESIMPPGSYTPGPKRPGNAGSSVSDRDEGAGSNNWVLAGTRTQGELPLLASDPHVPYAAVSMWHEVHLLSISWHVVGIAYVGVPAIMIGRNERVAWGLTNNICSVRDLYKEQTSIEHPGCFLFEGEWEPAKEHIERIDVRGAPTVELRVVSSRNGPIVDEVLPPLARHTGPVALRWLGAEPCHWLTAMLGTNRAKSAEEFRATTRPWQVPTFNLVFADTDGHIGHQCVGRIPIRKIAERGYRPGWEARHQWAGVIPFEEMPHQMDPPRGFAVSANNRLAPDDFPFPLAGTWSSGYRARRIRQSLESNSRWSKQGCRRLQYDLYSGRAAACVPSLLKLLELEKSPRVRAALDLLEHWDFCVLAESPAAAIFNVFFVHWCRAVAAERLPRDIAEFAAPNAAGLANALLELDENHWFARDNRQEAARDALLSALDELQARFGPDTAAWQWGKMHRLLQKHVLSGLGDLGQLLDQNALPMPGDSTTVCNMQPDASYNAYLGASYRMFVDMAEEAHGLWAISVPGQSGHPGSPHYGDQEKAWVDGTYHHLTLHTRAADRSHSLLKYTSKD